MASTHPIHVACWYPAPPPALPGENEAQYTDRLTGADRTGRVPYDHPRNRQCSIGWHRECTRGTCLCPCHSDTDAPSEALPMLDRYAVDRMQRLYSLPLPTARRVLYLGMQALDQGIRTLDGFREHIGAAYLSEISEGFGIDLAWALDCADRLEGCPPAPQPRHTTRSRGRRRRTR